MPDTAPPPPPGRPAFSRKRALIFGKDADSIIKSFFGCNAMVAIVVLALITIFLFKEGFGFIGLYHKSLQDYRHSGLEYVDILKEKREGYTALTQYLNDVRAQWIDGLKDKGLSQRAINERVMASEAKTFFFGYTRAGSDLRRFVKEKMDAAIQARDRHLTNENLRETLRNFEARMKRVERSGFEPSEKDRTKYALLLVETARNDDLSQADITRLETRATAIRKGEAFSETDRQRFHSLLKKEYAELDSSIQPVDFDRTVAEVTGSLERYQQVLRDLRSQLEATLATAHQVEFDDPALDARIERFRELNAMYFNDFDQHLEKLRAWSPKEPISIFQAAGAFLTGRDWVTASDQQDWYGLLPLLTGSLLISAIALFFAIPFGVGAAIYVNQIAGPAERNFIKPYIEFVSAIPSVVIGFFGVVVFGEVIRALSRWEWMDWVPFFPIQERLNAFTAGCLLALMAIPTIFTLAEDAINNIPRHFEEASLAVGATQLQTTMRVIVPTALSGIISAIMLGFGRVIGETMVVLLCAGNRIKIPDFTHGMGVFFEPVHTMTGIIAQEMGEVVHGSLHYRALFMVGIVLFFISLFINYSAQWVVKRYRRIGD